MRIEMLRVDREATRRSSPDGDMFSVHIQLSTEPDGDWRHAFELVRRQNRHYQWCKARVVGGYVVVDCALDELQTHVTAVADVVAITNDAVAAKEGRVVHLNGHHADRMLVDRAVDALHIPRPKA